MNKGSVFFKLSEDLEFTLSQHSLESKSGIYIKIVET